MTIITIDTLEFCEELQKSDISQEAAKIFAKQ